MSIAKAVIQLWCNYSMVKIIVSPTNYHGKKQEFSRPRPNNYDCKFSSVEKTRVKPKDVKIIYCLCAPNLYIAYYHSLK